MSDRSMRPDDPAALRRTVAALEAEVDVLRRRLQDAPGRVEQLEARLADTIARLQRATEQNEKLTSVLEEAREQLSVLRSEVEKLTSPPNNFGTVLGVNADGSVDVVTGNRKLRVAAQPTIEVKELARGQEVLLNESFTIVDTRGFDDRGEVVQVRDKLNDGRLVVIARADDELVIGVADSLTDVAVRVGDHLRLDATSGL
ncbi:MAG: proteasome ATPase, partial [Acidimicrobiia bacterium]|nr:proteasome ATPase [Acidimicrobiia bacterium]